MWVAEAALVAVEVVMEAPGEVDWAAAVRVEACLVEDAWEVEQTAAVAVATVEMEAGQWVAARMVAVSQVGPMAQAARAVAA